MARLETLVLDPELVRSQRDLRIVYTPIHGTGGVIIKPMLERLGFTFDVVTSRTSSTGVSRPCNRPTRRMPRR